MFNEFIYLLKDYGVPVSFQYVIDFYKGLEKGLAPDLDKLLKFSRLTFVKKLEHQDAFERAFALYFMGIDIPNISKDDRALFGTEQFKKWLDKEIKAGRITHQWSLSEKELMKRFWETLRQQMEEHHGGKKWIGTDGYSPFGHSGKSERGIRVYGESTHGSAIAVIGDRRFAEYSYSATLSAGNIRQALDALKHMLPKGPRDDLNLDETIYRTAKNAGEIELVLQRMMRDKIKVILFLDSGGYSMNSYLPLTRRLFSKIKDRFRDLKVYHFHNCIYGHVLPEEMQKRPWNQRRVYNTDRILKEDLETRVLIVGDATMSPGEITSIYEHCPGHMLGETETGKVWLNRIRERFKYSVWLNPISKPYWSKHHGLESRTIIGNIFHMEDLTLQGIKNAVEYLNSKR